MYNMNDGYPINFRRDRYIIAEAYQTDVKKVLCFRPTKKCPFTGKNMFLKKCIRVKAYKRTPPDVFPPYITDKCYCDYEAYVEWKLHNGIS